MRTAEAYDRDLIRDESHKQAQAAGECALWLEYLEGQEKAPRYRTDCERSVAKLLRLYPRVGFGEFTEEHCLKALLSFPSASRPPVRSHLTSFFRWGKLKRRIPDNPMEYVEKPKGPKQKVIDIYSDAECALLESGSIQVSFIFTLLLHCGLRRSELLALQRKHIDEHEQHVVIYKGKGDKDRIVPFGEHVAQRLATFDLIERLNPDDYVVFTKPGGYKISRKAPSTAAGFHNRYKQWVLDAGVRYRNPHTCRHSMAVRWLRHGGRLEVLSMVMGHSSITTTSDQYLHLDHTDARADLLRIEAYREAARIGAEA